MSENEIRKPLIKEKKVAKDLSELYDDENSRLKADYGEFVPSFDTWIEPDAQRRNTRRLTEITKIKKNKEK